LNKKFNYYKHRISYLTGTCYNFEMEEFFSSFLRRAGMPASARLSCFYPRDAMLAQVFGPRTLYKFDLREFLGISQISDATTAKRMKIDQYCQRQRCK